MLYRLIQILGDRHAGFLLGMLVILNLAAGSLVMNLYPELYPPFFPFDLNFFFMPVEKVHWWLYALLVTFTLFGINLAACLIESIVRLMSSRTGRLRQWAALLFHIALFITMGAHLYDGFFGSSGQAMITPEGDQIPGIGTVTTLSVDNIPHPDGSLKDTLAKLRFDLADGSTLEQTIAYNEPAIFDGGRRELIIQGGDNQPVGVTLADKASGETYRFMPYAPVLLPGGKLSLEGMMQSQMGIIFAQFTWQSNSGERQAQVIALTGGQHRHNQMRLDDKVYVYKEMIEAPYVAAMIRYNPAIPLIMISLLTASLGTLLLIYWARNSGNGQQRPND